MTSSSLHPHHERRWLILAVLGLAQLMVILDVTVVNIALPSAREALGFSDANRQWIVTAYTLAFGGLLLLAGRVADLVGRKRTLVIGLAGSRSLLPSAGPRSRSAFWSPPAPFRAPSERYWRLRRFRC